MLKGKEALFLSLSLIWESFLCVFFFFSFFRVPQNFTAFDHLLIFYGSVVSAGAWGPAGMERRDSRYPEAGS